MATKFGQKLAKIAPISVLYNISRHFLRVACGIRGRRIQICYPNFQGRKGSCHGNQVWAKISQNCIYFSSVQHIELLFARRMWYLGSANSNMLSEFSRSKGSCHGNQIWAKISQICTYFTSVQDIDTLFACRMWYSSQRIQICYSNFQGRKGSCHGNQIWAKMSQNCTYFSFVQDIETVFACNVGLSGSMISNMLYEFFQPSKGSCHGNQIWAK